MSWLVSLFAGNKQSSRRGQAMHTTHEAFSLPTSSPIHSSHADAFDPDTLQTPDPESATSRSSYTYPPVSPIGPYGYGPTFPGSRSRGPILPLHSSDLNTPTLGPLPSYPPLSHTWDRLKAWLASEYPELGDTLNYGILPEDLAQIEMQFGTALPPAVRQSYLVVDGQEAESSAGCSEGLFFGLTLLPLDDVLEEWRFWRDVDDDPATGGNARLRDGMQSIPRGWVRKEYSQRGWLPLIVDKAGNYVGVDLNPAEGGSVGQVIVFGRDFDTKVVLWNGDGPAGWAKWLASFVDELESGEGYELGGTDLSDGSEDGLGYESYYYDGTGRGQGDGGGDTSSGGGLKLTGEYRGWNILEAWADRSVRKWNAAGMMDDTLPEGEKPKKPALGILSLANKNEDRSGAEVIMPVLADIDEEEGQYATAPSTHDIATKPLPIINITKPPAPLPVTVPTTHDIVALPSPPDSTHSSFDLDHADDLESGRGVSMRQIPSSQVAATKKSPPLSQSPIKIEVSDTATKGAALIPLPVSPAVSTPPEQVKPLPHPATDLLDDSAPVMESIPIEAASPSPRRTTFNLDQAKKETPNTSDAIVDDGPSTTTDPEPEPDTTIRLVGGGGIAGTIADEELPPDEDLAAEVKSIASGTSIDSVPTAAKKEAKQAKHKKNLSTGLKKLGQFGSGGRRKKDSSSSIVKESN